MRLTNNTDWKDRFRAEYYGLSEKIGKLQNMLEKYRSGTLDFKPNCSYELLYEQLIFMKAYRDILIERAEIEDIDLETEG